MTEIPRTRDVIVLVDDVAISAKLDDALLSAGWPGGQGVTWVDSPDDTFFVSFSDGTYGGFLLWGSDEDADQFISTVGGPVKYEHGVVAIGTWIISTSSYERFTLESRTLGPLVPNTYVVGDRVRFSLRGLFTPQDEWTISGDPRAPNNFFVGSIVQVPQPSNNEYLMVQTLL